MSGPKKKAVKKQVRKAEEELGIDPGSLFGGALIAGIASLFDDDDEEEDEDESDGSIFDIDDSDDSDDDSGDFGGGDSGGGGSDSDW